MNNYDSDDSSVGDESGESTNVLLGYASKSATDDIVSQLGGHPSWIAPQSLPSGSLSKCKVCNSYMSLLLQLNGDLPDRFPGHERRLYVWTCRNRPCKRKPGSIRAFRGTRIKENVFENSKRTHLPKIESNGTTPSQPSFDYGAALFGVAPANTTAAASNPFTLKSSAPTAPAINTFATAPAPSSSLAAKSPQQPEQDSSVADLPATFAEKARISNSSINVSNPAESEAWPLKDAFPKPYPHYFLDADYEYLFKDPTPSAPSAQHAAFMDVDTETSQSGSSKQDTDKDIFESPHDTAFQHFADRLSQNPEQVLRYEFGGTPLLYSKTDMIGKVFATHQPGAVSNATSKVTTAGNAQSAIPACNSCGAARSFELQLTPQAIVELEADLDMAQALKEGMEWGTIIIGVCTADCVPAGTADATPGYVEEWAGVQWEEVVERQ